MAKEGTVNIHGKDYLTVAKRVKDFRDSVGHDLSLETEIVEANETIVVMKAVIREKSGFVLATGHAEEVRASSKINSTSALENCETSAIGRALASLGFGGTEFASANEVQNAIAQQKDPEAVKAYATPRKTVAKLDDPEKELATLKQSIASKLKEDGYTQEEMGDVVHGLIGKHQIESVEEAQKVLEEI